MALALHRLGRWCVTHRWRVLLVWLAALLALGVLAGRVGGEYSDDFTVPGVESQAAVDLLQERFPDAAAVPPSSCSTPPTAGSGTRPTPGR